MRKLMRVDIPAEFIVDLLKGGRALTKIDNRVFCRFFKSDFPSDMKIVDARWNWPDSTVTFLCESETFPEHRPGEAIQHMYGTMQTHMLPVKVDTEAIIAQQLDDSLQASGLLGE